MMRLDTAGTRRFILLDRDGTVIEERHYLSDPGGIALVPGATRALCVLQEAGFGLAIVTNQAGVGRGMFGLGDMDAVHERLKAVLSAEGVALDGIYACPHTPDDDCRCRKPMLGLFEQAQRDHRFDPAKSFMIGDKAIDVEFGRAAGMTSILVRTGYGAEVEREGAAHPHHVVDDLPAAAELIRRFVAVDQSA